MSFSAPTALVAQAAADTAAERKKQEGRDLPLEEGRITAGMAYDTQPRYSPDGTQLVFISDRSSGDNLWTLDLATGDMTQVTTGNGVRMDVAGLDPGR
jgi:Tol biopolymer transport system component